MLASLLGSKLRANVLGWLFSHPDERFFVRQLASLLGEDHANLGRELARLADMGIVVCETEGRQKYYQANRACAVFEELRSLAVKTTGIADVLRDALEALRRDIVVAFIYGSFAAGDHDAESDVDLMVVGNVGFGEVVSAIAPGEPKLGREINPTVYSPDEFRRKVQARHHFLTVVQQGPKTFLIGNEHELVAMVGEEETEETSDEPRGDR